MPIRAVKTLCVRTDKARWKKVATEDPPWDERNRLIGSLIPENSSIVDLGSGAMTLKRHLKAGCHYQPCDVVRSPEVLFCDFNERIYPALDRHFDYTVCSGILEYMRDPADFLTRISRYGSTALLSYNPLIEGETRISRLGKGWVNHFTQSELEELFARVGLKFELVLRRDQSEVTYKLVSLAREESAA